MSYIPLRVHTDFSIGRGFASMKEYAERASELGLAGFAITDVSTMAGIPEFLSTFKKSCPHMKPVVGMEVDVLTGSTNQNLPQSTKAVLLVKDLTGYRNLCRLASIISCSPEANPQKCLSKFALAENKEGLICISTCPDGEIARYIQLSEYVAAEDAAKWYKSIFGEDFYIDIHIQDSFHGEDYEKLARISWLAEDLDIETVVAGNVCFASRDQIPAVRMAKRMAFLQPVLNSPGSYCLLPEKELACLYRSYYHSLENAGAIMEKVETIDLSSSVHDHIPATVISDHSGRLSQLAWEGFDRRYPLGGRSAKDRLKDELAIVKEAGYEKVFLFWNEIASFAVREAIPVGPGRGTMAGSMLAYCLGITEIDPVKHGLRLERTLAVGKVPDIDMDMGKGGIEKVLGFLKSTYGAESAAYYRTYERWMPVTALAASMRINGIPEEAGRTVLAAVRSYAERHPGDLADGRILRDCKIDLDDVKKFCEGAKRNRAYDEAAAAEGHIRRYGISWCKLLAREGDLAEVIPLEECRLGDRYVTCSQFASFKPEDYGVFDIDLIETDCLDKLQTAVNLVREWTGDRIDLNNLPDDSAALAVFWKGNTDNVFGFVSPMKRQMLKDIGQSLTREDLAAVYALCMKGKAPFSNHFVFFKHYPEEIKYNVPELEKITGNTYSVFVFQEQFLEFMESVFNLGPQDAERLRLAFLREDRSMINHYKAIFMAGAKQRGISNRKAGNIWQSFRYGQDMLFNKSHAVAYADIAYRCAYIKAHYPDIFAEVFQYRQ